MTERLFTKYSGQGPLRGALSRLGLERRLDGEGEPPVQLSGAGRLAYCENAAGAHSGFQAA